MSQNLMRIKGFLLLCLVVGLAASKPSHFPDSQVLPEGDKNDIIDPVLFKAWERYYLKRLASDYDNLNMANDIPMDHPFRNPEMKRQGRSYRQCYFNPISCFRK
ncbi:hypothetical protein HHI36_014340 [Cryptolaemus montrouzieri]|uniref:Uncharacterized protein n=1 Tax=Cryptolaemus montrouzieri TaxID=559131 RepID=A0ABD2N284_9CUCU